tara:strand:- start:1440 stop:1589 length:150 start_codon:yes stop_codon:yes gene_type:complete
MNEKDRQDLMAKSMKQAMEMVEMMDKMNELVRQSFERQSDKKLTKKEGK